MVPHRDHGLQCPVPRGSACGHRESWSHVGDTGGCETHVLACITLLSIVPSSHTCGIQTNTHTFPFSPQFRVWYQFHWIGIQMRQDHSSKALRVWMHLCPQNSGLEFLCTPENAARIGVFGRCLLHERRVLMIWVGVFLRIPREHTCPCPPGKDPAGRCQMWTRKGASPEGSLTGVLTWGFQPLGLWEIKACLQTTPPELLLCTLKG